MGTTQETKACEACAKSKRKCGRQIPTCQRCQDRRLVCHYPPSRQTCWVLSDYMAPLPQVVPQQLHQVHQLPQLPPAYPAPAPVRDIMELEPMAICAPPSESASLDLRIQVGFPDKESSSSSSSSSSAPPTLPTAITTPDQDLDFPSPPPQTLTFADLQSAWFLTDETWDVHMMPHTDTREFSRNLDNIVQSFVSHLQFMLSDWALTNRSGFIHARLYARRMPRCTQDAFTTLSTYLSRAPATEHTIARILADRISQLIGDQPSAADAPTSLDVFSHIARTQALLVYLIIGLFDGDIRLRHVAEGKLPTLALWSYQLLHAGRIAASNGQLLLGNMIDDDGGGRDGEGEPALAQPEGLWHAWILAESARRTWLIASGVRASYKVLQDGQMQCNGGLMFTTGKGVWDAKDAWDWASLCAEQDCGFMMQRHTQRIFSEKKPDDVDDFGKMMLEVTYGKPSYERWTK